MASQSDSDRTRITALITEALNSDAPVAQPAAAGPGSAAAADPKELFCKNWDTVKQVLAVLRTFAPGFLKPLIDLVIKAGNALQKAICK